MTALALLPRSEPKEVLRWPVVVSGPQFRFADGSLKSMNIDQSEMAHHRTLVVRPDLDRRGQSSGRDTAAFGG